VRERVERLEQMMADRNSVIDEAATPTTLLAPPTGVTPPDHPAGHTHTPLSGSTFKKSKIKNCKHLRK
jgi:hypothetical protein